MSLSGSQDQPRVIRVREVRFLGEQDGDSEQLLKEALLVQFSRRQGIQRAYLARANFGAGGQVGVVLGLRTHSGHDAELMKRVASTFAGIFADGEHLDIMFLTAEQESELRRVCGPFFEVNYAD